jgi:soluble lytic murein transglycosylase-like protein
MAMMPHIDKLSKAFGIDRNVVAAIIYQESRGKNLLVHKDGTGHGLIGLDDNGRLSDFEQFVGKTFKRGHKIKEPLPARGQIDYLVDTLSESRKRYGGDMDRAIREWHRGPSKKAQDDELGKFYNKLIDRISEQFRALKDDVGGWF